MDIVIIVYSSWSWCVKWSFQSVLPVWIIVDLNFCHVSVEMDPGRKLKLHRALSAAETLNEHMADGRPAGAVDCQQSGTAGRCPPASRSVQNMLAAAEVGTYDECFQQTEANKSWSASCDRHDVWYQELDLFLRCVTNLLLTDGAWWVLMFQHTNTVLCVSHTPVCTLGHEMLLLNTISGSDEQRCRSTELWTTCENNESDDEFICSCATSINTYKWKHIKHKCDPGAGSVLEYWSRSWVGPEVLIQSQTWTAHRPIEPSWWSSSCLIVEIKIWTVVLHHYFQPMRVWSWSSWRCCPATANIPSLSG